jgi:hypothetical protein
MSYLGRAQVGLRNDQVLDFFIDSANAKLVIADADAQPGLLKERGAASVLTIRPLPESPTSAGLFAVDWLGRRGARAGLGNVASLQGLTIASPQCSSLVQKMDQAPARVHLDLSHDFKVTSADPPELKTGSEIDFTQPGSAVYEAGLGWLPPAGWGSFAIGSTAVLAFKMPGESCRAAKLHFRVDPYLPPSRPNLDTQVWINDKLATVWHFTANGKFSTNAAGASDNHEVLDVEAPLGTGDTCKATVSFRFARPGAPPPPYPKAEDSRPLQMRVLGMKVVAANLSH